MKSRFDKDYANIGDTGKRIRVFFIEDEDYGYIFESDFNPALHQRVQS